MTNIPLLNAIVALLLLTSCTVEMRDPRIDPAALQQILNEQEEFNKGIAQAIKGIVSKLIEKKIIEKAETKEK